MHKNQPNLIIAPDIPQRTQRFLLPKSRRALPFNALAIRLAIARMRAARNQVILLIALLITATRIIRILIKMLISVTRKAVIAIRQSKAKRQPFCRHFYRAVMTMSIANICRYSVMLKPKVVGRRGKSSAPRARWRSMSGRLLKVAAGIISMRYLIEQG